MSWNPSINFKLRDDQVAFGDLIFDKNGATLVADALKSIKDGNPVNMDALRQILTDWCFTDSEFESLKDEFEQIKIDIAAFKEISSSFGAKWVASIKSVGIAVDYVAGSATWVQKYKENKAIAAGLYQELKKSGYQFSVAEQQEYDKRYFEVMQSSTDTELVETFLQKQYRENLAAGDKDAVKKYCDALVETGCLTRQQADEKAKMLGYFAAAGGYTTPKPGVVSEPVHGSKEPDKPMALVLVTSTLLNEWYDEITALDSNGFPAEADSALDLLYRIMCHTYREAEIPTPFDIDAVIVSKETAWDLAKRLKDILTLKQNAGLIEAYSVSVPADNVERMRRYWLDNSGYNSGLDGYEEVTDKHVFDLVRAYNNCGRSGPVCDEIYDFIVYIHNQCDDVCTEDDGFSSDDRNSVLDWCATFGCEEALKTSTVMVPRKKLYRLLRGESAKD